MEQDTTGADDQVPETQPDEQPQQEEQEQEKPNEQDKEPEAETTEQQATEGTVLKIQLTYVIVLNDTCLCLMPTVNQYIYNIFNSITFGKGNSENFSSLISFTNKL
jgi:hypothetical protein